MDLMDIMLHSLGPTGWI